MNLNLKSALIVASAMGLLACAPAKPKFFDLQPKEKVAIGSFYVNGYIAETGAERLTPGLLQDKKEFYKGAQQAIDSAAPILFEQIQSALPDIEIIKMSDMASNEVYQKTSRPSVKSIMGMSISEADGLVYAEPVGFVSEMRNEAKADSMMTALGVNAMITIKCDADLETAMVGNDVIQTEASLGPVSLLDIKNTVSVSLYRKGLGKVWNDFYTLVGKENAAAIGYIVADEKLPRLFVSSLETLPAKLAEALNASRNRPTVASNKQ